MTRYSRWTSGGLASVAARPPVAWCGALAVALVSTAGAATFLRSYGDPQAPIDEYAQLGYGDLDGDGVPEVLGQVGFSPSVLRAFAGATGEPLRDFTGADHPGSFGEASVVVPDVTADGVPDVLVGAPGFGRFGDPPGVVFLLSGADGAEVARGRGTLSQSRFGEQVAVLGDVDDDGVADFAGGGPGSLNAFPGEVRIFSGAAGGDAIATVLGTATDNLGASMVAVGDVNGDGSADLAVGAPGAGRLASGPPRGRVSVVSGRSGEFLRHLEGRTNSFGRVLSLVGDFDGDGRPDLAIASAGASPVVVVSTRSWKTVRSFPALPGADRWGDAVAAGDVNGDGFADVAIGGSVQGTGGVYVLSGAPGTPNLLASYESAGDEENVGSQVALAPDLDGDGILEMAIGGFYDVGGVKIVKGEILLPAKFAFAFALSRPEADLAGSPTGVFRVRVDGQASVVTVACAGLPPGGGLFTAHLEDGVQSGVFRQIGSFAASSKGAGAFELTGEGQPPAALGIADLRDLAGRRIEVRDAMARAALVAALPFPGPLSSASAKSPLVLPSGGAFPKAKGKLKTKFVAAKGSSSVSISVKGVKSALSLEVESSPGSGFFAYEGAFAASKFVRDTGKGQALPGGAAKLADLRGRGFRVTAEGGAVLTGVFP